MLPWGLLNILNSPSGIFACARPALQLQARRAAACHYCSSCSVLPASCSVMRSGGPPCRARVPAPGIRVQPCMTPTHERMFHKPPEVSRRRHAVPTPAHTVNRNTAGEHALSMAASADCSTRPQTGGCRELHDAHLNKQRPSGMSSGDASLLQRRCSAKESAMNPHPCALPTAGDQAQQN